MTIDSIPNYIWALIGFVIGFGLELFICSLRKDGIIHVTKTNDSDRYLFEFNVPPEKIPEMKHVVFSVVIEADKQNLQST